MSGLVPIYPSPLGKSGRSTTGASSSGVPREAYFKPGTTLSSEEQAFCRCVAHVEAKGSARNPYAVCAKSVGTTSRRCGQEYEFSNFPDDELIGYAEHHKIPVPNPYQRKMMLENITAWAWQEKHVSPPSARK